MKKITTKTIKSKTTIPMTALTIKPFEKKPERIGGGVGGGVEGEIED